MDNEASLQTLNDRWNKNVILMGDFNDEPFDKSILEYLQAVRDEDKLEEGIKNKPGQGIIPSPKSYLGKKAFLFNCMWKAMGNSDTGTHHFNGSNNTMNMLDQFIISKGLYYGEKNLRIDLDNVKIYTDDDIASSEKKRPVNYKWNSGEGYSDHFPIECKINLI